ncbi:MAG: hypothetical protein WCV79_04435 [Candidatus Paceibacterota bacterium]|jgi:hypothetical protein
MNWERVMEIQKKKEKAKDFPNLTETKKPMAKDLDLRKNLEIAKGFQRLRGLKMVKPKSLDLGLPTVIVKGFQNLKAREKGFLMCSAISSEIAKRKD